MKQMTNFVSEHSRYLRPSGLFIGKDDGLCYTRIKMCQTSNRTRRRIRRTKRNREALRGLKAGSSYKIHMDVFEFRLKPIQIDRDVRPLRVDLKVRRFPNNL